jgi:RNA recognition motif-containing protein
MSSSSNQPNNTLYINNLNDKVSKEELKVQLLALFATYGKVIDIIASKSRKMRGQAFLVFIDLASATSAMRACEGMMFYDKPLVRIYTTRPYLVYDDLPIFF